MPETADWVRVPPSASAGVMQEASEYAAMLILPVAEAITAPYWSCIETATGWEKATVATSADGIEVNARSVATEGMLDTVICVVAMGSPRPEALR